MNAGAPQGSLRSPNLLFIHDLTFISNLITVLPTVLLAVPLFPTVCPATTNIDQDVIVLRAPLFLILDESLLGSLPIKSLPIFLQILTFYFTQIFLLFLVIQF